MEKLKTYKEPKSRTAEAFRTLRTNIQFADLDDEIKSLVITSTGPGDGKSTVICNLAVALAQSGKKVLLIDCDLRRPTVHKNFDVSNKLGLTNILIKQNKIEECLIRTNIENLSLVPSGPIPPNPSELLGSKRMSDFVENMTSYFDILLLDAPPVLAVTDAQVLSRITSKVLLLVCYGKTEKKALIKSKELLDRVGAKIVGVVLNKVTDERGSAYYEKYYGYYESNG